MARPQKCRLVNELPRTAYFKPSGLPVSALEVVSLSLDEFEALRLADLRRLEQAQAAKAMKVSRQTFGNILREARGKVAECLSAGKALKIDGGKVAVRGKNGRGLRCGRLASEDNTVCPKCPLRPQTRKSAAHINKGETK